MDFSITQWYFSSKAARVCLCVYCKQPGPLFCGSLVPQRAASASRPVGHVLHHANYVFDSALVTCATAAVVSVSLSFAMTVIASVAGSVIWPCVSVVQSCRCVCFRFLDNGASAVSCRGGDGWGRDGGRCLYHSSPAVERDMATPLCFDWFKVDATSFRGTRALCARCL